MLTSRNRRWVLAPTAAVLVLVAAACSGSDPTATPQPTASPRPAATPTAEAMEQTTVMAEIANFTQQSLTVKKGATVIWTNKDAAPHTSTSGVSPNAGPVGAPDTDTWNSGIFNQDGTFSHTFDQVGTFPYFCTAHPFMTATVTVTE